MNWELFWNIISGIIICIPLVAKLVEMVDKYAKEKNWSAIVTLVLEYMKKAEELFEYGAERKQYVLQMIEKTAVLTNYKYNEEAKQKVSQMIDDICKASKVINSCKGDT